MKKVKRKELIEALRVAIIWGECVSLRLTNEQQMALNWKPLERVRRVYLDATEEQK